MTYVLSATILFSANLYSLDRQLHNMAIVASQGSAHSRLSQSKKKLPYQNYLTTQTILILSQTLKPSPIEQGREDTARSTFLIQLPFHYGILRIMTFDMLPQWRCNGLFHISKPPRLSFNFLY